jgi:holliday junction DNA helicase RuvA
LIGRLTGKIVEDSIDGTVVVDVSGVGYDVMVPLGTVGRATPDASGAVTLAIHTHVREDALLLYGFATSEDRAAFRHLIGVSNIGPKIALSILGALSVPELSLAIARGETVKLTKIPGVGKKTAERIVLELKDKLLAPPPTHALASATAAPPPTAKGELLQGALTRMGFRPAAVERAVASLGPRVDAEPLGDLIRDALALLR